MASAFVRSGLLQTWSRKQLFHSTGRNITSIAVETSGSKLWNAIGLAGALSGIGVWFWKSAQVKASDFALEAPNYPFTFKGFFSAHDMSSVRRGYEVYKQVCAACHSMEHLSYLQFIDQFMTEEEAKAEAASIMVKDGPDEAGKMYDRPGRITDFLPAPYANDAEGAAANNGAVPPDLSVITQARMELGGEDYIMALLTGYEDPPAGVDVGDGQAYNPYFLGGVLSMAQQLWDDGITYEDGTPATASQQAKDVSSFLKFATEPYMDKFKLIRLKYWVTFPVFCASYFFVYRNIWAVVKSEKIYEHMLPYRGRPLQALYGRYFTPHQANNTPRIV